MRLDPLRSACTLCRLPGLCACLLLLTLLGCRQARKASSPSPLKQASSASLQEVHFFSPSLNKTIPYLIYLPAVAASHPVPSVYLLHGAGTSYRDWAASSDVQPLATAGYALILPEGDDSYFLNAASPDSARYEDFLAEDLIPDVEKRFPIQPLGRQRAIVGVSMGGFGALTLALHRPGLFSFVAALSPPLDAPARPFAWQRFGQSMRLRRVFGPPNSPERKQRDLFVLLQTADVHHLPHLFLSCGKAEPLLPVNRRFAHALAQRGASFTFETPEGGHAWGQWNTELPHILQSLQAHVP